VHASSPAHWVAQSPHWLPLYVVSSHPLPQSSVDGSAHTQPPLWHTPVGPHWLSHAPQWSGFDVTSTHTPWPHSIVPSGQVAAHAPFTQNGAVTSQGVSHAPQCAGSLDRSMQRSPHAVPMQMPGTHSPALHASLIPHSRPHRPQSSCAVSVSTHPPLQSVRPVEHDATHAPASQNGASPAQVAPHPPQLFGSDWLSMHTPSQKL
jgi:hypothetical protein